MSEQTSAAKPEAGKAQDGEHKVTFWAFIGQALRLAFTYRLLASLVALALLVQIGFNLLMPLSYRYIFDKAIVNKDMPLLAILLGVLAVGFLLNAGAGLMQDFGTATIGSRVSKSLQEQMFSNLQKQSTDFFSKTPQGDIIACFGPDVMAIETALVRGLPSFCMRLVTILTSLTLLFVIEWRLALVALALMPMIAFAPKPFGPRARKFGRSRDDLQSGNAGMVQENLLNHLTIRTFNLSDYRAKQFGERLSRLQEDDFRANFFTSMIGRSTNVAAGFLQIGVLGVGAILAVMGFLTTGLLIAFIGLLLNIGGATDNLTQAIPLLVQGMNSYSRIQKLLSAKPDLSDGKDARALPAINENLKLQGVEFSYQAGHPILRGVDIEIPAGQTVAIVGGSGSGKSTVLSLLMRLYDPVRGKVMLDNMDLRDGTEASLRAQTSVVLQNTALFDTTIAENIRMGRLDATDEEIVAAAKDAGIHDLIESFPDGYQSVVGSQGGSLSGGQRQRIAIARALLRQPRILFLDEATSALDAHTEAEIGATLDAISADWTVVSVTHRFTHITGYDLIIVMEKGLVVESGTHEELLAKDGRYAMLWRKQSGFTITDDGKASVSVERLREIPFLSECNDEILQKLSKSLVSESFAAGKTVFEEGEPGSKFYIVARGKLENYVKLEGDKETPLGMLDDGDYFGEMALIRPVPRTWSVRAVVDSTCISIDRQQFMELMDADPKLKEAVTTTAYERAAEWTQAIMEAADV
ncbi:ABC transporter transmembrane domain-containing protein [Undibacterium sp. TS12]|uniref:ABC transporter transmembrane domain-containing protein n=1 Tax=Undibacterium sp. TS12 TaxID=2908202 RepID=UPI001F4CB275|nr:ABC transporter transmembrane domain-containing protein [Undibacterium sp. TS12]MCH8621030.1 ABC transporter transmembrane domain-containing protein [Undibacterium sp. TS12]